MSRYAVKVFTERALTLPKFGSHAEAEVALFAWRDHALSAILSRFEKLDFSGESLKYVEGEAMRPGAQAVPAEQLGAYWGEVLCRHARFQWIVQESILAAGHFGIGITRGMVTIMLTKGRTIPVEGNKRLQSLWREYKRFAP